MTFGSIEESRHSGEPVNLYLFVYGTETDSYFAYTDAEQAITYGGKVYDPIPLNRGSLASSGTLDKATIEVSMPTDAGLAELYRIYSPGRGVSLTIREGHLSDPDLQFVPIWIGRIISCERKDSEAIFSCEPISTTFKRSGLRRNYQYGCPHALYGGQCLANRTAATSATIVQAFTGNTVTLPSGWSGSLATDKYLGGMLEWERASGTESRTILRVASGITLTLSGNTTGLSVGTSVSVILGCNHKMNDCRDLHGNILNFGGQPWIPFKNPIKTNPFF